jgi:hypothetical protein
VERTDRTWTGQLPKNSVIGRGFHKIAELVVFPKVFERRVTSLHSGQQNSSSLYVVALRQPCLYFATQEGWMTQLAK